MTPPRHKGSVTELFVDLALTAIIVGLMCLIIWLLLPGPMPVWGVVICAAPLLFVLCVAAVIAVICLFAYLEDRR